MLSGRFLRNVVSLLLAAVLLWVFLRSVDLAAVGRAIAHVKGGWLTVAVVVSLLVVPFRSWRWTLLLARAGRVPQPDANVATAIGFAMSTLLPARAGEIVRPVVLTRRTSIPLSVSMASVGLERLLDLVAVLVLFIWFALSAAAPAHLPVEELARLALLRKSALLLGAVALFLLPLFGLLGARPALGRRLVAPFLRLVPAARRERAGAAIGAFLEGLGAVRTPREILLVGASTIGLWLFISLQVFATLRAFDLGFSFPVAFFVITWSVMGLAIPTPGGVGGFHAAVAYSLTGFFAVGEPTAKAFAIVSHLVSFAPVTILGLAFLSVSGLGFKKLAHESEEAG